MKHYLIANWKAEMEWKDVTVWLNEFRDLIAGKNEVRDAIAADTLSIIVCPPFPFIPFVKATLDEFDIFTGSQDVSSVINGKYTGEVTAQALTHYCSYSIVGHSEQRRYFNETDEDIERKMMRCEESKINTILCVRNDKDTIFPSAKIIAFEPVEAIGSGKNEKPHEVLAMKKTLTIPATATFVYGGSVDEDNVKEYIETGEIHGFLVGTASLHAETFFSIAKNMLM